MAEAATEAEARDLTVARRTRRTPSAAAAPAGEAASCMATVGLAWNVEFSFSSPLPRQRARAKTRKGPEERRPLSPSLPAP